MNRARRRPSLPLGLAILGLVLVAVLGLPLAGCGREEPEARAPGREVKAAVAVVAPRPVADLVAATGHLEAAQSAQVSTRAMGWIERLHVDAGDRVRRGDPLVSIDDSDVSAKRSQVEAGIAEAQAVLQNATTRAERFRRLREQQSVSQQQLDDVLTQVERAESGLRSAQAMREEVQVHLGYLSIRAPFDGVVVRRFVEAGNMASPGTPLLQLEQNDRMKVVARVGEKDIGRVAVGDTVMIEVTSVPDARFRAPIERIGGATDPGSRTYDIETHIDNAAGRLRSGMFARVLLPVGRREAVVVPAASVVERGQLRGVWTVSEDGLARLRWIRLGREVEGGFEVISGLDRGERIVVGAEQPLVEGDRVVS